MTIRPKIMDHSERNLMLSSWLGRNVDRGHCFISPMGLLSSLELPDTCKMNRENRNEIMKITLMFIHISSCELKKVLSDVILGKTEIFTKVIP